MKCLFIIINILCFTRLCGQNELPLQLLQKLKNQDERIDIISKRFSQSGTPLEAVFHNHPKNILTTNRGIFIFINGTGRLYQLTDSTARNFTRIDSTLFWGYNNGCFPFTYKNDLYNLGGTGIWRSNGQLRKYNFYSHEWDIIPLNQEIPISFGYKEGLVWYDQKNGVIYTGNYTPANSAIIDKENYNTQQECMMLNLETQQWSYAGNLTEKVLEILPKSVNLASTPKGLLVANQLKYFLFDFSANQLLESTDSHAELQSLIKGNDTSIIFYSRGFFYKTNRTQFDSFPFRSNEWVFKTPIYKKSLKFYFAKWRVPILLLVISLLLIWLRVFVQKYKAKIIQNYQDAQKQTGIEKSQTLPSFSDSEWSVISLIYKNSKNLKKTYIDEINQTLGLQNRSIEIQKAQRHKNFSSINKKFQEIYNRILISNEKLPMDKRSLLFFIEKENLEILDKHKEKF